MGVRGLNQKSKNNVLYEVSHGELIPSRNKKRRIDLKFVGDKQTDGWTHAQIDRVNDRKIIDS